MKDKEVKLIQIASVERQIKAPMSVRMVMPGPEPMVARTTMEATMTASSTSNKMARPGLQHL